MKGWEDSQMMVCECVCVLCMCVCVRAVCVCVCARALARACIRKIDPLFPFILTFPNLVFTIASFSM